MRSRIEDRTWRDTRCGDETFAALSEIATLEFLRAQALKLRATADVVRALFSFYTFYTFPRGIRAL